MIVLLGLTGLESLLLLTLLLLLIPLSVALAIVGIRWLRSRRKKQLGRISIEDWVMYPLLRQTALSRWITDYPGTVFRMRFYLWSILVAVALVTLAALWQPQWASKGNLLALYIPLMPIGGVIGSLLVLLVYQFFITPYKQRNDLRKRLERSDLRTYLSLTDWIFSNIESNITRLPDGRPRISFQKGVLTVENENGTSESRRIEQSGSKQPPNVEITYTSIR